eukprot:m.173325 g.173325  ORF g.173325 m.173325 type:complete len:915 (+) comp13680_c0_seq1:43-2787(+)
MSTDGRPRATSTDSWTEVTVRPGQSTPTNSTPHRSIPHTLSASPGGQPKRPGPPIGPVRPDGSFKSSKARRTSHSHNGNGHSNGHSHSHSKDNGTPPLRQSTHSSTPHPHDSRHNDRDLDRAHSGSSSKGGASSGGKRNLYPNVAASSLSDRSDDARSTPTTHTSSPSGLPPQQRAYDTSGTRVKVAFQRSRPWATQAQPHAAFRPSSPPVPQRAPVAPSALSLATTLNRDNTEQAKPIAPHNVSIGGEGGSLSSPSVHQQPFRKPIGPERPPNGKAPTTNHHHSHHASQRLLPSTTHHTTQSSNKKKKKKMAGSDSDSVLGRFLDAEVVDDAVGAAGGEDVVDSLTAVQGEAMEGACVECEEAAGVVRCDQCDDLYCKMCFTILHRKGHRTKHTVSDVDPHQIAAIEQHLAAQGRAMSLTAAAAAPAAKVTHELGVGSAHARLSPDWFVERCKFIPIRLTLPERKRLRLFVASLAVSDYTGRIDRPQLAKGAKRLHQQMREMCSSFTGLTFAQDEAYGREVLSTRKFETYKKWYNKGYEVTRRHKIMNPEKLRTNYGKLVYLLQDAHMEEAQGMLGFSLNATIKTVYDYFEDNDISGVLREPDLATATMEILPEKKPRHQIQAEIKAKERARERIARKYAAQYGSGPKKDDILWALYSIGDNFSFLNSNRKPIDTMIAYLKANFRADSYDEGYCLAISGGVDGARLTHSHSRHYHYVLQSLTLWREINDDMFRLWYLAEQDLLTAGNKYVLKDTGQGMQRVQAAPRVLSAMRTILHNCQQRLGEWIGSSVIHLGDDNVPNAMMFVDKYTQVAKILSPIIQTIREIDILMEDDGLATYINKKFGGPRQLKQDILFDFFRNAFDGSGADNFFDAGSCIDGRLTSAWNWCATLQDKPFFHVFLLSGFIGFDGEFQE